MVQTCHSEPSPLKLLMFRAISGEAYGAFSCPILRADRPLPDSSPFYTKGRTKLEDVRTPRMTRRLAQIAGSMALVALLAACGGNSIFGGGPRGDDNILTRELSPESRERLEEAGVIVSEDRDTIFDLFSGADDPNVTVEVNRYLWNASLEVLDFMPVEGADPFSGVIVFGFATPPGGSRAYRATVFIRDPALEARSLRVAVQSRNGAVSRETALEIEDAILTRARQLRIADGRL